MSKRSDLEARIRAAVEAPGHDELSVEAKIQAAVEAYNKEFPIKDEAIAIYAGWQDLSWPLSRAENQEQIY